MEGDGGKSMETATAPLAPQPLAIDQTILRTSTVRDMNDKPRRLLALRDAAQVIVDSRIFYEELVTMIEAKLQNGYEFAGERAGGGVITYKLVTREEALREMTAFTPRWPPDGSAPSGGHRGVKAVISRSASSRVTSL